MICEKCGKEFPDHFKKPIRCLCSGIKADITVNFEKKENYETLPLMSLIDMQRKLWEELHTYIWISEQQAKSWFHFFCLRVPCGECKSHWFNLIEKFPPDFSSKEMFFEWGVMAHNKVNERLEKPQITLDEAKRLWLKV